MSGDLPVVVELFDPVHDEPQAQARGANGEELRLLVFIDREELCTRERTRSAHTLAIAPPETTCGKAGGRTRGKGDTHQRHPEAEARRVVWHRDEIVVQVLDHPRRPCAHLLDERTALVH